MPRSETCPGRGRGRRGRALGNKPGLARNGPGPAMPPDWAGPFPRLPRDRRRRLYGLCRRRPSLILGTMEGNPGGAAPAERSPPLRDGWHADRGRASDADRGDAIRQLRERYAEGRVTHDTLSHRLEAALQARYQDDLA